MKSTLGLFFSIGLLSAVAPAVSSAQTPAPKPSGIFLVKAGGEMTPIPSESSGDVQNHGMGKSIATQGIMKPTQTARYPGAAAAFTITDTQPTFFFRFVDTQQMSKYMQENPMAGMAMMNGGSGGSTMLMGRDAKEYTLAKIPVDGDARVISSKGMETVKVQVQKKAPLEFDVHVMAPLTPGQYAFYMGAGSAPAQIFAFTVK